MVSTIARDYCFPSLFTCNIERAPLAVPDEHAFTGRPEEHFTIHALVDLDHVRRIGDHSLALRQIHHVKLLAVDVSRLFYIEGVAGLLLEGVHEEHLVLAPFPLRVELLAVARGVLAHPAVVLIFRWGWCGCLPSRGWRGAVRSMRAVLPGAVGGRRAGFRVPARSNGRGLPADFRLARFPRCELYHRSTELLGGAGTGRGLPSQPRTDGLGTTRAGRGIAPRAPGGKGQPKGSQTRNRRAPTLPEASTASQGSLGATPL